MISRLIESGRFYNLVQRLAGVRRVDQRLRSIILETGLERAGVVLDLGGGTGLARKLWPPGCQYICADNDPAKLQVFAADHPSDTALLVDATETGIPTGSVDAVICKAVAHHLPDQTVADMLDECRRVLNPGGRLVFLEPLLITKRLPSHLLWIIDRGSYPRSAARLTGLLEQSFKLEHSRNFSVLHQYLLCIGAPKMHAALSLDRTARA